MNGLSDFDLLTLADVAKLLHCSKAHVCKAVAGRVHGLSRRRSRVIGLVKDMTKSDARAVVNRMVTEPVAKRLCRRGCLGISRFGTSSQLKPAPVPGCSLRKG
jgi:hypothetical protein